MLDGPSYRKKIDIRVGKRRCKSHVIKNRIFEEDLNFLEINLGQSYLNKRLDGFFKKQSIPFANPSSGCVSFPIAYREL